MSATLSCPKGHVWDPGTLREGTPHCPVCGAEARPAAAPGPRLPGYQLLAELGRGRLGVVYQARHLLTGRVVALKLLSDEASAGLQDLSTFCHDARADAQLSHPGLVPVLEAGDAEGRPYITWELAAGETLQRRLPAVFAAPDAARLVEGMARAVHHAHQHKLLHLGLSPANVTLTPDGAARVADMGLAPFRRGHPFAADPAYAAPELADGPAGPAADVYALGAILYALLTGRPPFLAPTPEETLRLARSARPVPPHQLRPDLPLDLELICLKCLQKESAKRYANAEALADDLRRFFEGRPVQAQGARVVAATRSWVGDHGLAVGAGVAGAVGLALALAVTAGASRRVERARHEADYVRATAAGRVEDALAKHGLEEKARTAAEKRARDAKADAERERQRRDRALKQVSDLQVAWKDARKEVRDQASRTAAAEGRAREADGAREEASARRGQAMGEAVRLYVTSGTHALEAGDLFSAALRYGEALRLAQAERLPEDAHRARLAAVLAQCPRPARVRPLDKEATLAAVGPDGRQVVTTGSGQGFVWELSTGERLVGPMQHEAVVRLLVLSPDGKRALTADADRNVHGWDLATGKALFDPIALEGAPLALAFSGDGKRFAAVVTPAERDPPEHEVQVYDAGAGTPVGKAISSQVAPRPAALTFDGTRVVTLCLDRTARVWDADTGDQVGAALEHGGEVVRASFSPDGRHVVTASADRTARVWDAATGKPRTPPLRHGAALTDAAFGPGGRQVLTVGEDRRVRVWDAQTGEGGDHAVRHAQPVVRASFSPDGRHVLTAGDDGAVRVWDAATGADVVPPLWHRRPLAHAAFTPDGRSAVTLADRVVRVWDLTPGEPPAPPVAAADDWAARSPDGKWGVRLDGKNAQLYDVKTGKEVGDVLKHGQPVRSAAFSPDGKRLLTVSHPEDPEAGTPVWEVRAWDAETVKPVGPALEHLREVTVAAFGPDGARVVTAGRDRKVRVWDAAKGSGVGKPMDHDAEVERALFSPDGKYVLTADADGTVRVWDADKGERAGAAMGHAAAVSLMVFRPDGRRFATAAGNAARVWELVTGSPETKPLLHGGDIVQMAFSRDGGRLAVAAGDRTARVWDAEKGSAVTRVLRHPRPVHVAAFDDGGKRLLTASADGVRVWEVVTGQPLGPPLRHGHGDRPVRFVALTEDGTLSTAAGEGEAKSARSLKPDDRPAADLVRLAQVLAGRRPRPGGEVASYATPELVEAWQALAAKYPKDFEAPPERRLAWAARGAEECERRELWHGVVLHLTALAEAESAPASLYARRGQAYARLGDWARARADFGKAIDAKADGWEVYAGRARASAGLGKWDDAVGDYAKAIEREGRRPELWQGRGRAEAERGKEAQAAKDFAQAVRLRAADPEAWHLQALALLASGDKAGYQKLCAALVKRLGASKDAAVARAVARACTLGEEALPDLKNLLKAAEEAVAADPESADDLRRLAALLYRTGEHEAAIKRTQEALRLKGQEADGRDWLLLALASKRLGKDEDVKKWLAKADDWLGTHKASLPWERRAEFKLWRDELGAEKGDEP